MKILGKLYSTSGILLNKDVQGCIAFSSFLVKLQRGDHFSEEYLCIMCIFLNSRLVSLCILIAIGLAFHMV